MTENSQNNERFKSQEHLKGNGQLCRHSMKFYIIRFMNNLTFVYSQVKRLVTKSSHYNTYMTPPLQICKE